MSDRNGTTCPSCDGRRTFAAFVDGPSGGRYEPAMPCSLCKGTGVVQPHVVAWMVTGRAHRGRRVNRGENLRECAVRLGITPSELSAMENGRADPERIEDHG